MAADDISDLFQRYLAGGLTTAEQAHLMKALALCSETELESYLQHQWQQWESNDVQPLSAAARQNLQTIFEHTVHEPIMPVVQPVRLVHFLHRWGWAAAVILFVATAVLFLVVSSEQPAAVSKNNVAHSSEILPGREGAILTLADGRQVVLDSLSSGVIASQNGTEVILKNGGLSYDVVRKTSGEIVYNTMSTPKGRQFHVTLPDGTQVWLNAASSIRYPTVFNGVERRVEISGEAYFEVASNKKMPFLVKVNDKAEVEVLGTHFNVNAYDNETSINTTLMEGSVRVKSLPSGAHAKEFSEARDHKSVTLQPGQQAQIFVGQKIPQGISIHAADIDKVMAWKNGLFNFDGASFEEVMKQIERWYDIVVVYEKSIPNIRFEGKMTKGLALTDLLMALERSDVNFRIDGKKLIVLP